MELPLHPKIVHLPIALAALLPLLSAGLLLAIWRNRLPRGAWSIALGGSLLLVGTGFLARQSGERDEERVERLVPEAALEAHEEAGERFLWASAVLAALAIVPLVCRNRRVAVPAMAATTAVSLAVLATGWAVGQAGGELVYRDGAAAAFAQPANPGAVPADKDDDDR